MDRQIGAQIIAMRNADLQLRQQLVESGQLFDGYHPAMEQMHNHHAQALENMMLRFGYPTAENFGAEASEAAWLIMQHSIGRPDFMRLCKKLLEEAVAQQQADPVQLAYLGDRIAVLEGNPQHYGTQFDWDDGGELSPLPCHDPETLDDRRTAIGLKTIKEQTMAMRQRAAAEGNTPPKDPDKRRAEATAWKRRVGWLP